MNVFEIIGYLVVAFILFSLIAATFAWLRSRELSPKARAQFVQWRTLHNNAFADGDHFAAKLYKAKELAVYATDHPIGPYSFDTPLMCVEGELEQKSEEELDELIAGLQSLTKSQRVELIRNRKESAKPHQRR